MKQIKLKLLPILVAFFACLLSVNIAYAQDYPVVTGDLEVPDLSGPIEPGSSITISGGGFSPGADVTVVIRSEPLELGTTTADATGFMSIEVTLPEDFPAGDHTLSATGFSPDGTLVLSLPVEVAGGDDLGEAPDALAFTGSSLVQALLAAGAIAAGGLFLVRLSRRTSTV